MAIDLIPGKKIKQEIGEAIFTNLPLYNQPEYLEAVSYGNAWFARIQLGESESVFFPFTGEKWLWRWRIYQTAFCQKFTPFSLQAQPTENHYTIWFEWLRNHSWSCHWPHTLTAIEASEIQQKRNQFFSLEEGKEEIISGWKSNRRSALNRCQSLRVIELDETSFFSHLEILSKTIEKGNWKPNGKEIDILKRICLLPENGIEIQKIAVMDAEKILSLIFTAFWNGRHHYLFSLSNSVGYQKEAVTKFMHYMVEKNAGNPQIFDFEGSNLEGVSAFFRSFAANEELYGLFHV